MAGRRNPRNKKPTRAERSAVNRAMFATAREQMRDKRPEPGSSHEASREELEQVIDAVANGDTVRGKCRELALHPGRVLMKIESDPELSSRYALAKRAQAHSFVEQTIDDLEELAQIDTERDGANVVLGIYKHKAEVRKWCAGKFHVRAYGDKVQLEGGDPDSPIRHIHEGMSPREAAEAYAETIKSGKK